MTHSVTLLGVKGGPAIRPGSNMPTSILLRLDGRVILVDAGLGVSKSLCDQGVSLTGLNAIFVTHLHSDHYLELGPLLHTAWVSGLKSVVPVFGPKGLHRYWDGFLASMADDIDLRIADEGRVDLRALVELYEIEEGRDITLGDIVVRAMRNEHPPLKDSFALRFEADGKRVVLSGDTAYMPEMAEFARGADLLVHEAMLVEGVEDVIRMTPNGDDRLRQHILRSHTAASDVGRVARDAGVKWLALNHFVPDGLPEYGEDSWENATRETWNGPLLIGRDGLKIEL